MSEVILTPLGDDSWLDPVQRTYLIAGEDEEQISDAVSALRARHVPTDLADFDLDELNASSSGVEEVLASAQRAPILAERRVVVLEGCELYAKAERRADAARLAQGIRDLLPLSVLVLVRRPDDSGGRRGSGVLTTALDGAVSEVGVIVRCPALDAQGLVSWASRYSGLAGKTLSPAAAQRITQAGGDRTGIRHDLDKVIAYVGDRPSVEVADVDSVVGQAPEDVMFRLVDAVAARRTADALVLLRRAARYEMRSQSLAPKVISLLARQLKLMWQVNELKAQGVGAGRLRELPQDVAAQLPKDGSIVPMAWRAGIIARDAGRWGRADLVRAFGLLVACDAANKGEEAGSFDTMANLEGLVVELCEGVTTAS